MIDVALRGTRGSFVLDAAFTVSASGVTALLGQSGSGKTSVLRGIAGLDRHAGTVCVGDAVWQDATTFVPAHRRRVGWVAQGAALLPHLTVAANLDYGAKRAVGSGEATQRARIGAFDRADIIARTGIAALLDRRPATLSGGEARRAAIARALLGQPRLLLLDEPLAGLDGEARGDLIATLAALFAATALPVILVTHEVSEADRLATRIVRIDAGRIV